MFRSRGFYKNLSVNILLWIFGIYFISIFFIIGLFLHNILDELPIAKTPLEIFNGSMLYIILIGLTFRYFMQQLMTINMQSYQSLPIKRSLIVNYILLKPFFNPANYLLFFVVIPFAMRSVSFDYGGIVALRFVLTFLFIVWFNSLMASFIKRKFGSNLYGFLGVIVIFGAIFALEYFKVFSLFTISGVVFDFIVLNMYGLIIPILAVIIAYLLNRWFFSQNFYAENFEKQIKKQSNYANTNLSFLNRFGMIGDVMALELKLIWRHKRTKNLIYLAAFFLLYGLLFYGTDYYNGYGTYFFCATFITGIFMLFFGQWVISWNSSHFDCLMTRNLSVRAYLTGNLYLMLAGNLLGFILTIPYFLYGKDIVIMHITSLLYNSGINTFLLTFFATFYTKRVDLAAKSALSYQGTSFKNFLIMIPLMFFPLIIVGIFSKFIDIYVVLIFLSALGIIGLLFQKQLITICVNQFNKQKYALCEGFRQMD